MKNKKTAIIVTLIVIVFVSLIGIIIYAKTDLLKTDKAIFYKYLGKIQLVEPEVYQRYQKAYLNIEGSNYSSIGKISCSNSSNNTNISNIRKLFDIDYNVLKNLKTKQYYADYTIISNKNDCITLRYLKDSNIYAVKLDNILTKYVALENKNIKDFFKRIGVEDVSKIPDSIPEVTTEELFSVEKELREDINKTYGKIINEKIKSDNFTKTINPDKTIKIELSLSEKEVSDIVRGILEALKNDKDTLNLIINKATLLNYELNIDSLKTSIQEEIDKITNTRYSEEKDYIKIAIIENGKKTLRLEGQLPYKKEEKSVDKILYTIDLSESNKLILYINNQKETNIKVDITFGYEENNISTNIDMFDLNKNNNEIIKIQYQMSGYETNNIKQNALITIITDNNNKTQIEINDEKNLKENIQIDRITNNNSEILNNKSEDELSNLIYAIFSKVQYLYGEQTSYFNTLS